MSRASVDSFGSRARLRVGDATHEIFRLDAVAGADRLPYALKVLLENLLRTEDGAVVSAGDVRTLAAWDPHAEPTQEITFTPSRVLMHDTTGVPALVDLATLRAAMQRLGGDPETVQPAVPADLVIDHSVAVDVFGRSDALARNVALEYERNAERYRFLRWGQQAFAGLRVVPPGAGIVHQVNVEHLATVVTARAGQAFPDTLVGTDSHTTMVNGLGVLAWGVGGIEAVAALLGEGVSLLVPRVVGVELVGTLPEGATATDLVLTLTEILRTHGVVGKIVEFHGEGVANVPVADRATVANMSPEFGSTCALFPMDGQTLEYLRLTGRGGPQLALVEAYAKAQGLWHDPDGGADARYSENVTLDLATVVPSLAGPRRPQDRVPLAGARRAWRRALCEHLPDAGGDDDRPRRPTAVTLPGGASAELDHGAVVIAAITSCTNTSNPALMLGAGLLAKKAVERGLATKPWVKTSLAPGSQVIMDAYAEAGLTPYLDKLGFNLVGFGCTTCIGNSGPLPPAVKAAVDEGGLAVVSVLSGNRNFEGRINPDVQMNYLASPPLVVAYALAGTMDIDLHEDPLGTGADGRPVYLADLWPTAAEVEELVASTLSAAAFSRGYEGLAEGDERWRALDVPTGPTFAWDPASTYLREAPYFDRFRREPPPLPRIHGARALVVLGDSVTTDHISPAGAIRPDTPAASWLVDHGVELRDFNSYPSRRGNHEVLVRATFGNPHLRNRLVPERRGGYTRNFLAGGAVTAVYEAARAYADAGVPLVVLAGKEYGTGSSRDWGAKGPALLGVRAVIAETFERIHRSNLVGMGVLPLQLRAGDSVDTLGLRGDEVFAVEGLEAPGGVQRTATVRATGEGRAPVEFPVTVRLDTAREVAYFRHGGVLPYVLRSLAGTAERGVGGAG